MSEANVFLEAAHRIGAEVANQALWAGDRCTWNIRKPDLDDPRRRRSRIEAAQGDLYQGTAGIALFLAELVPWTGGQDLRDTAIGAMGHALEGGRSLPDTALAFHAGRVGIAHAAQRVGRLLDRPDLVEAAWPLLAPLLGNEDQDHGIDVIAGAAGAIPVLLRLAAELERPELLGMAERLGRHLIRTAHREPGGWSWRTLGTPHYRHLTGMAHGASGMAHALLELHAATGGGAFRYAAEQALNYERQFLDHERGNWPDFRHARLRDFLRRGPPEALKALLVAGTEVPPYETSFMNAWCHGAPGIGLARLSAWKILRCPAALAEARTAIDSTVRSFPGCSDFSLCHGVGGNAETLLVASAVLDDPALRRIAEEQGLRGWSAYGSGRRPWPCGTLQQKSDPSLMLGEAGIGYFYLRLHSERTPSLLLPTSVEAYPPVGEPDAEYWRLLERDLGGYFGRTLGAVDRLHPELAHRVRERALEAAPLKAPVVEAYETLCARIDSTDRRRAECRDAFRYDRARFETVSAIADFSESQLRWLRPAAAAPSDLRRARFRLRDGIRLSETRWGWESHTPTLGPAFYLHEPQANTVRTRRIGPFASVVLRSCRGPDTHALDEIVARVQADVEPVGCEALLMQRIRQQLQLAIDAGYVTPVPMESDSKEMPRSAARTEA